MNELALLWILEKPIANLQECYNDNSDIKQDEIKSNLRLLKCSDCSSSQPDIPKMKMDSAKNGKWIIPF